MIDVLDNLSKIIHISNVIFVRWGKPCGAVSVGSWHKTAYTSSIEQ